MPTDTKQPEHQPFLDYSDDDVANQPNVQNHKVHSRTRLFSHSLVLIVTSLFWIAVIFINSPTTTTPTSRKPGERHNITSNAKLVNCGTTAQEARALGCQYDILMNHWVPSACRDEEFVAEYKDDGSWGAYVDANMTQRINSIEEMSEMEFYYTSVRDHINHCSEMWKKQFYVLFEEWRAFDSIVASAGHTDHCAAYLADVAGKNITESTKVEVGFAGCWIKD